MKWRRAALALLLCAFLGAVARRALTPSPPALEDRPEPPGARRCGADGVSYPDEASARRRTVPVHAGPCGACSNAADLATYRRTAATLTGITQACALRNLILGEAAGRACLQRESGLSPGCLDCWVANMSCTAARCLGVCLWAKVRGDPPNRADGQLNACLACDEAHCGGPFIRCAGANRRRAGITSDIQRTPQELWR